MLEGPTALAFVRGDAALAAKALNDAARAMHMLEFKGGLMDGDDAERRRRARDRAPAGTRRAARAARRHDRGAAHRAGARR